MSAITATESPSAPPPTGADRRPGAGRLTAVELRKMVDTRAGFWLPLGIGALTVVTAIVLMLTEPAHAHTFHHTLYVTPATAARCLLPVMGVLLVTSEWSQRTALTTFTLVPNRARVLGAKLAACLVVSVAALVVALAVSALAEAVSPGSGADAWSLAPAMIPQAFLYLATGDDHRRRVRGRACSSRRRRSSPTCCCRRSGTRRWGISTRCATWPPGWTVRSRWRRWPGNPLSATDWTPRAGHAGAVDGAAAGDRLLAAGPSGRRLTSVSASPPVGGEALHSSTRGSSLAPM